MSKIYNLKRDKSDERDLLKAYTPHPTFQIPAKVDLRPLMPPVFNQGELGSCSANAGVAYFEYLKKNNKQYSRLNLYYNERSLEGSINEDSGAQMRDIGKALVNMGVCEEQYMPYDITKFTVAPSLEAQKNGLDNKLTAYSRLRTIKDIVYNLAVNKEPVLMGMEVFESFESEEVAKTGIVPMPKLNEENLGGHAVLIVGYELINGKYKFIVRNSWGPEWGDKGYFYVNEDFIKAGYAFDFWSLDI